MAAPADQKAVQDGMEQGGSGGDECMEEGIAISENHPLKKTQKGKKPAKLPPPPDGRDG